MIRCDAFICEYWQGKKNSEDGICTKKELKITDGCCAVALAKWGK